MAFVRTNGVLLHYRMHGRDGAPVVALVNSLGTDARIWDDMIDLLSADYRVLSYDKRGHGLSDAPRREYTLTDHIGDLAGLLDHVGIGRLALGGVSVGGLIAQGFALRHRDRLAALLLCDTAPKIGDSAFWNDRIATIRSGGLAAISDDIMDRWFSARYRRERGDDLAGWRNLFLRSDIDGYCGTCATLRDTDLTPDAATITTPTLVVVGKEDGSTPVEMVRATAAAIPGARFEIIAGAGHIPSIERPAALAKLMTNFLKEVGHG
ncbi:MAG: 3-oxoadipate enol-lactonase [Devosia sp.]